MPHHHLWLYQFLILNNLDLIAMTTSTQLQLNSKNGSFRSPLTYYPQEQKDRNLIVDDKACDDYIWKKFLATNPIINLLRPDFYMIYKFSKSTILYQQNINLDLGACEVTFDKIMQYVLLADQRHIHVIDNVMTQIIHERKLQPFDYIYKICGNVECPNPKLKRLMRTSFLLHSEKTGVPGLGFVCFHNVTGMVSSIKPNNFDITFDPDHSHLSYELNSKLKTSHPSKNEITSREKDILHCIDQGMSSKAIASHLFISKATVDTHRQNMLRKRDAPNTASLLKIAREEGWI